MMSEDDNSKYDVDMDDLVTSMKMDLDYWGSLCVTHDNGSKCCLICKVVPHIHESDRSAYEPSVLSIGPYHHGALSLLAMEKEKWICLDYILKMNCQRSLHDYLRLILELEKQAKSCYSEEIKMENKDFLQMLLLDSCFILVYLKGIDGILVARNVYGEPVRDQELLKENMGHENEEETLGNRNAMNCQKASANSVFELELSQTDANQHSTQSDKMEHDAVYDLLLLENQIPFFIVKRIYELVSGKDSTAPLLTINIAKFMEGLLYHFPIAIQEGNRPKDFHHLLHLCHLYLRPSHKPEDDCQYQATPKYFHHLFNFCCKFLDVGRIDQNERSLLINEQLNWLREVQQLNRWRRAVEYHGAGIEFRKRVFDEQNPHSLLDIKFRNGVMEMPCLPIDEKSSLLFRNLTAFEQTCPQFGDDITAYVVFMSQLISQPEDVALLAQKGIIVHQLEGDEGVSALFTKLCDYGTFNFDGEHYLKSLCCTMEAYYQSRPNRWMAWLRHNHFSNPWMSFAALASAIIVFCTVMQTVLAFVAYMRPPT